MSAPWRWGLNYQVDQWFTYLNIGDRRARVAKIKAISEDLRRVQLGIPSIFG